jgi:hypothetical protein
MKPFCAVLLIIQMIFPAWAAAQQPVTAPQPSLDVQVNTLKILVLEGAGAVNNTTQQQGTPPVIEVNDSNDRPVEGATVVFRLPISGAGGFFVGQTASFTTRTNIEGQAVASGFTPNKTTGHFNFHVTAISGNRIGETDISQSNTVNGFDSKTTEKHHFKMTKWKWVVVGAGAAAITVGIILLTRGSSGPPTVSITPGPVTIGGGS